MCSTGWMTKSRLVLISDRWDEDSSQSSSRVLDAALEEGRFIVVPARRPLYASGRFRAEALRDVINVERERASSEGYRGLVAIWDLEWLKDEPDDFEAHIIHQSTLPLSGLPPNLTLIGARLDLTTQQLERVMRVNQLVQGRKLARQFWLVANSTMGRSPQAGHRHNGHRNRQHRQPIGRVADHAQDHGHLDVLETRGRILRSMVSISSLLQLGCGT